MNTKTTTAKAAKAPLGPIEAQAIIDDQRLVIEQLREELKLARLDAQSAEKAAADTRSYCRAETDRAQKDATAEREANNGLRTIIRDLELTVERHRGFQDGMIEAQPPRMVPEKRETVRNNWPYPASEIFDPVGVIGSTNPRSQYGSQKPWWHK